MPKPVKLHSKGKPSSIQKGNKVERDTTDRDPQDTTREFQLQLCWCIQQLERSLKEKKGTEKQLEETWKVLAVLKNNHQPIIRKRQLMRTHFGDYRAKMAAEEYKLVKMASKIKISESPAQPKATFLRKSAFITTGDDSFRFNFNIAEENVDNEGTDSVGTNPSNINSNVIDDNVCASVTSVEKNKDNIKETSSDREEKKFKFTFSSSSFKFNFNVEDS